jgi:hypothetical protein
MPRLHRPSDRPPSHVVESSLDQKFFEGMDATLESLWRRYWLAELGVEQGIAKLGVGHWLGAEPWPGSP